MGADPNVFQQSDGLGSTSITCPKYTSIYERTKRLFDILLAASALLLLLPVLLAIGLAVKLSSPGPALHWSKRVGRWNSLFLMPKFRSMRLDTPQLATHLLQDPRVYLTGVGRFLRRTSLDELPQLYSILKGDLSFVGPRPALFNQYDLMELRTHHGIHELTPGLTGWAQVNGRDELTIPDKVAYEREYLAMRCFSFDCRILCRTLWSAFAGHGVSH